MIPSRFEISHKLQGNFALRVSLITAFLVAPTTIAFNITITNTVAASTIDWQSFPDIDGWDVGQVAGSSTVDGVPVSVLFLEDSPGTIRSDRPAVTSNHISAFGLQTNNSAADDASDPVEFGEGQTLTLSFGIHVNNVSFSIWDIDKSNSAPERFEIVEASAFLDGNAVGTSLSHGDLIDPSFSIIGNTANSQNGFAVLGPDDARSQLVVNISETVDELTVRFENGANASTHGWTVSNVVFQIPEPSTFVLTLMGLLMLSCHRRLRCRS